VTRRIVWLAVLLLALAVVGGSWFVTRFERVPVQERTEEEAEARRNPYLALERFLNRLGRPLTRQDNARALDALPPNGALILDRQRRQHMTPARVDRLLTWVDRGGYLVLVPEAVAVDDPLLAALKVSRGKASARGASAAATAEDDEPAVKPRRPPERATVSIPGAVRPFALDFRGPALHPGEPGPDWSAATDGFGSQVLHFPRGQGHVTVVAGFSTLLTNRQIGRQDHAEFLWTLLQTYAPAAGTPVILATRLTVPNLWDWLAGPGLPVLAAGSILLGLWLWRVVPRFGPPQPEPPPDRRELREHLAAVGRYVWRAGGLGHWLAAARESFLARLALRHPALAALPPAEQAAALARLSQRSQSLIAEALHGPATSPHAYTTALRTLRNLERHL
jgi:hypothetical protein